jgi:hypothetical protein
MTVKCMVIYSSRYLYQISDRPSTSQKAIAPPHPQKAIARTTSPKSDRPNHIPQKRSPEPHPKSDRTSHPQKAIARTTSPKAIALLTTQKAIARTTPQKRSHLTSPKSDRSPTPQKTIALPHPKSDRTSKSQNSDRTPHISKKAIALPTSPKKRSHEPHLQKSDRPIFPTSDHTSPHLDKDTFVQHLMELPLKEEITQLD